MREGASSIDSPVGRSARSFACEPISRFQVVHHADRLHRHLQVWPIAYLLTHLHALASLALLNFARGTDGPVPRRRLDSRSASMANFALGGCVIPASWLPLASSASFTQGYIYVT